MKNAALFAIALSCLAPHAANAQQDGEEASDAGSEEHMFEFKTAEEEAMEEFEREMTEAFSIFGELLEVDPLTPEQEALLPLAERMADRIMPEGSFATVMDDTMEPMMDAILGVAIEDPRVRLAEITGVYSEDLAELSDEAAQEALDIFDPEYAARTDKTMDIVLDMVGRMLGAMEPAYREGLSRALTIRFDETEMTELLTFFDTPLGAKFASESFRVHYDPQMMAVLDQMGPAMVEVIPGMMEELVALEAEFAPSRAFSELTEAERNRAASLVGKSVTELNALEPQEEDELSEDGGEPVI